MYWKSSAANLKTVGRGERREDSGTFGLHSADVNLHPAILGTPFPSVIAHTWIAFTHAADVHQVGGYALLGEEARHRLCAAVGLADRHGIDSFSTVDSGSVLDRHR